MSSLRSIKPVRKVNSSQCNYSLNLRGHNLEESKERQALAHILITFTFSHLANVFIQSDKVPGKRKEEPY